MNTDQAWQSVLGQLQADMPKASFDTWVRDTEVVSCDDGRLVVGASNSYARDWLESRLTSTITRLLVGVMNRSMDLEFVVVDPPVSEAHEETPAEDSITLEPADKTRYALEVQPDRVVVFPGYALRLLEQGDLSPIEMSLYISFRQGVYFCWKKGQGNVRNIPSREIIRFAMMSRATFFREIKKRTSEGGREFLAGGMVEVVPDSSTVAIPSEFTDRRYANANRYRVQMRPRLTRRDCAVIEKILYAEAAKAVTKKEARDLVLAGLTDLAERKPDSYLDGPAETDGRWPRDVLAIVRRVLDIQGDIPGDLADAAEKVTDHILGAYGNVVVTHYFLTRVAPALGLTHPKAWAIIMLRDRCWFNYDTRVQHSFAIVRGGLETLAGWVGVTRKAVSGWMADPVFTSFVRQADPGQLDIPEDWQKSRTAIFLVTLEEPDLSQVAEEGLGSVVGKSETLSPEIVRRGDGKNETPSRKKRDSSLEDMRQDTGKSETQSETKWDSSLEEMRLDLGKSETSLNNLIQPLLASHKPQASPAIPGKDNGRGRGVGGSQVYWDFDFLTTSFAINPKSRGNLLGLCKTHDIPLAEMSRSLAAWLLYTHSVQGARIDDPVAVAVARVRDDQPVPHDFAALAALNPYELRELFERDLSGRRLPNIPEAALYTGNFDGVPVELKNQFQRRLFG